MEEKRIIFYDKEVSQEERAFLGRMSTKDAVDFQDGDVPAEVQMPTLGEGSRYQVRTHDSTPVHLFGDGMPTTQHFLVVYEGYQIVRLVAQWTDDEEYWPGQMQTMIGNDVAATRQEWKNGIARKRRELDAFEIQLEDHLRARRKGGYVTVPFHYPD